MKTLDDVQANMSMLFAELHRQEIDVKVASELTNIAGKWLKAEQLKIVREQFETKSVVRLISTKEIEADQDAEE